MDFVVELVHFVDFVEMVGLMVGLMMVGLVVVVDGGMVDGMVVISVVAAVVFSEHTLGFPVPG